MLKVTVKESSVVKPAEETPKVCLWTSNIDQLSPIHVQTVSFYRRPAASTDDFFNSTVVKDGLSKVLVTYYPIAGRLKRNESGRAEIDCTGDGVIFIEAEKIHLSKTSGISLLMKNLCLSVLILIIARTFLWNIWRCACKTRELKDDQETVISIPLDCRSRSIPPLPDGYFGNALLDLAPKAISGDIVSKPLRYAVNIIHETIKTLGNNEYLRSSLDYLELHPDVSIFKRGGPQSCNIRNVSWLKMPIYGADFGWGQPLYVGLGTVGLAGLSLLAPKPPCSYGGFSLIISLESDYHMNLFTEYFYEDCNLSKL
ncbi:hypothetical protein C5167_028053 [Papaver somniferum]|nr:hypothetical protein C5167_028053 [Papaver somniferum]